MRMHYVDCPTPSDSPFVRGRENAHAGDMRRRWCVAGLLRAESKFRRVEGHRAMPAPLRALEGSARAGPTGTGRGVA